LTNKQYHGFKTLRGPEGDFVRLWFSPDGRWMVSNMLNREFFTSDSRVSHETASERARRINADLSPRLWNLQTLLENSLFALPKADPLGFESAALTSDGKWLITGSFYLQGAWLWRLNTSQRQGIELPHDKPEWTNSFAGHFAPGKNWQPDA